MITENDILVDKSFRRGELITVENAKRAIRVAILRTKIRMYKKFGMRYIARGLQHRLKKLSKNKNYRCYE